MLLKNAVRRGGFIVRGAARNAWRNKGKSILALLICAGITLLLCCYMGNLENNRRILERMPDTLPVTGVVSNLNGMLDSGLQIKADRLDGILQSPYVKELHAGVRLMAGIGEFAQKDWAEHLNMYGSAVNSLWAVKGLTDEDVEFLEGVGPDFLESEATDCLIQKKILDSYGLKVGDTVTLTVYYYWYWDYGQLRMDPLEVQEYRIAGALTSSGNIGIATPSDILLPLNTIRESYRKAGIDFYAGFCDFTVENPLLLNEFKAEMSELGFLPVSATADYALDGCALTIRDDTFIRSAQQTKESIRMLEGFLPVLFLSVLFAGYLTAYLFTQNRRREYALMRSQGMAKGSSFFLFFGEYFVLAFAGSAAGMWLSRIAGVTDGRNSVLTAGGFLGCYLLGVFAAVAAMQRLSVMEVLTKND